MRSLSLRGRLPAGSGLLLIPAASLVVHQLRYTLGYGSRANAELAAQGHSYLGSLAPWFVLALGIGLALFLRRTALALATGTTGRLTLFSPAIIWLLAATGLLALYVIQESLEGLLAVGHPGGIGGVFGHGGLWAIPASVAVGGVVALCLRVARAVLRLASARQPRHVHPVLTVPSARSTLLVSIAPLARAYAGRAPPRPLLSE
jgi:hypothetical protein